MEKEKSIKLNFLMNALLSISSFIFPLITYPYVSRVLQPEGLGSVNFATSIITYFSMFAQLGIPIYGVKACARVRDDREKLSKTVHELLIINLVVCAISYCVLAMTILFVPRIYEHKTLFMVIGSSILFNSIGCEWLYKALEKYVYITTRSMIFKAIAVVVMLLLVHQRDDYVIYGGISIFAASAANILNLINIRRYISLRKFKSYDFKRHFRPILIYFLMSCSVTVYTNLDTVMIGFIKDEIEVAYYSTAIKVKVILTSAIASLGNVILPRASNYWAKNLKDKFFGMGVRAVNFVAVTSIPLTIYFMFFAREGVLLLAGDAYTHAILPMQIIMLTLFPIALGNIIGIQMLVPMGGETSVLRAEIIGAVVDFILNLILIPRLASAGAAISTVIAEICVTLLLYRSFKKRVNTVFLSNIKWMKIGFAVLVACACSFWVKLLFQNSFVTLAVSATLFACVYILMLYIVKEPGFMTIFNEMKMKLKRK